MNKIFMNSDKTVICHFDERSFEGEAKPDIFEVFVPKEINGVETERCKITFNYLTAEKNGNCLLLNNLKSENQPEVTHNAYSFRVDSLFYCAKGISSCWIEIFDPENEIVIKSDIITIAIDRHYTVSEYLGEEKEDLINTLLKSFDDTLKEVNEKINSFTNGKSAYEVAVENGYQGTETEWLESIKGYSPQKGVDYFTQDDIALFEEHIDDEINNSLIENLEASPLPIAFGGTGASTASAARTNLGAAAQSHTHSASNITSGVLNIARGGTGASTASAARANLGAAAQNHTHSASNITSGTLSVTNGGTGASTASAARTNLGVAAQNHTHSAGNITSGVLNIARGGTGASTAGAAFSALSEDTGWQDLDDTFNTSYWTNGATSLNAAFKPVQYRRVGKQVFINGFFMCNNTNNNFSTVAMKSLFSLPSGYRPTKQITFRLPVTGKNYARAYVTPNGSVGLDFCSDGNGTNTTLTTSLWFNFNNVSFFVD